MSARSKTYLCESIFLGVRDRGQGRGRGVLRPAPADLLVPVAAPFIKSPLHCRTASCSSRAALGVLHLLTLRTPQPTEAA